MHKICTQEVEVKTSNKGGTSNKTSNKSIVWAHRNDIRKARAQLSLKWAKKVQGQ